MRITKILTRAMMLVPAAGLLMGNSSCQQAASTRAFKKIVDLGQIQAPSLQIAPGENFDFRFVMNQQAYGVFMESEGFALRYNPPLVVTSSGTSQLNLSAKDTSLFQKAVAQASSAPFVNYSKEASCMVYLPQAKIYGSVNSFEAVGGGGLSIGFNPTSGALSGLSTASVSFNLQSAQLDMSMTAVRPLTNGVLASVNVDAKRSKMNFSAAINFLMISIGPSFWYQTPLSQVTKNALTLAVDALKTDLASEEWYTRVLANHDTEITIIGGSSIGFKVGDQLNFYNETYYWDGTPCASTYRGGVAVDPVATGEIISIGDEISIVKVTKQTDENVVVGAKVKLLQLAPETTKTATASTQLAQQ